jgi:hypothetical protein
MNDGATQDFEKSLARLVEILLFANAHLTIGRGVAEVVFPDHVLNGVAPTFWGTTVTAHLDVAQLAAFKLFDTQPNALTVQSLLNKAVQIPTAFADASEIKAIIDRGWQSISGLQKPLETLSHKRNRIIAHTDSTIIRDPSRLAQQCNVTFSELDQVIQAAETILNDLLGVYNKQSNDMHLSDEKDFREAIQLIVDAKHQQSDECEKATGKPGFLPRPRTPRSVGTISRISRTNPGGWRTL